jgi:hypothetical protein
VSNRGQDIADGLLRLFAQKLWAERANPISIPIGTWIGCFQTDDRVTWRSTDAVWQAQLERSTSGSYVSLALFCPDGCVGRFDQRGWHAPNAERRHHRPRPLVRSIQLPLAS